jgi:heptosyltransferase-2
MPLKNLPYQNILLLQTAFLGDAILTTPLIRALRKIYSDSKIDILATPQAGIVFRNNPHVNQIFFLNKKIWLKKIYSIVKVIFQIKKQNYDLAISIQSSLTSSLLMFLAGIPERLGFSRQKLLTQSLPHTKGLHKIQKILRLLELLTDKKFDMQTEIFWTKTEEEKSHQYVAPYKTQRMFLVGIAPGSIWNTKRWLQEYYTELVTMLEQQNIKVILIGGNDDYRLCRAIKNGSESLNLAGSLTILESAALIEKLDLLITNDSAPLHIANAVKTDVIAIFGPTVKDFGFYPYRDHDKVIEVTLDCRPCGYHGGKKCPLKHHNCMKFIKPQTVFNEVIKILSLNKDKVNKELSGYKP